VKHEFDVTGTPIVDDILESLVKGRKRIEQGWCQNSLINSAPNGRIEYCALGAIVGKEKPWSVDCEPGAPLYEVMTEKEKDLAHSWHYFSDTPSGCVVGWNNHPTTTKQDVLNLFDRAIAARMNRVCA
jgi:hypothetical protein